MVKTFLEGVFWRKRKDERFYFLWKFSVSEVKEKFLKLMVKTECYDYV